MPDVRLLGDNQTGLQLGSGSSHGVRGREGQQHGDEHTNAKGSDENKDKIRLTLQGDTLTVGLFQNFLALFHKRDRV